MHTKYKSCCVFIHWKRFGKLFHVCHTLFQYISLVTKYLVLFDIELVHMISIARKLHQRQVWMLCCGKSRGTTIYILVAQGSRYTTMDLGIPWYMIYMPVAQTSRTDNFKNGLFKGLYIKLTYLLLTQNRLWYANEIGMYCSILPQTRDATFWHNTPP